MLTTIIIVLLILWLLGAFGGSITGINTGNGVHLLLVIVIILIILKLLGLI